MNWWQMAINLRSYLVLTKHVINRCSWSVWIDILKAFNRQMADSSPECGETYNLRARKRKYFENDSDSSPIQCGQRNTKSSSEGHYTQIKLTWLKCKHICICLWYIGTITFYYIANLTCVATWPKYTIFGWGCHMPWYGTLTLLFSCIKLINK